MAGSLDDIRSLLTIAPRRLRLAGSGLLSLSGPLTLRVGRKADAAALADHPRIGPVVVEPNLPPWALAATRDPRAPWEPVASPDVSPEAFALRCGPAGLFLKANGPAGLRWGRTALAELLAISRPTLPAFTLEDAPAMAIRAVMVDVSRTCVEKIDYLKGLIDRLAAYRCNQLQLYFEERLAFRKHPTLAHPMAFSLAQMDKLGRYAKARGVELTAQLATFGHCQGFLQDPAYRKFADGDQIYQLNPLHRGARRMLTDMLEDWASIAHGSYVHAAFDEAPYFGRCRRTREYIAAHGVEAFMACHLKFLHRTLAGLGLRMMVWADMFKHYPRTLDLIPKDILLVEWNYDGVGPADEAAMALYRRKGFETLVAPAASRSAQMYAPARGQITRNIPSMLKLGLDAGARGAIICQWECLPRFSQLSEPGFALGCQLAWEGRTDRLRARREAISERLFGRDGAAVDRIFDRLSPDLLTERFRRLHFDPAVKIKTYHLATHETIATDPLIYLRRRPSAWARRVARRYEKGAEEALAVFDGEGPTDRLMRFTARSCLLGGWKRTKINDAGIWMRKAAVAFGRGDSAGCAGRLTAALAPVEQLAALVAELRREAPGVWTLSRYRRDPTFDAMYGRRLAAAADGCDRLVGAIRRCVRSVRAGGPFTLDADFAERSVLRFRIGLRAETGINIVNLDVHLSDDGETWRYDRRIESFQAAGDEYDYLWMPPAAPPKFMRVEVTRTQAAWTPADLRIGVYRLAGLTERVGEGDDVIDTEEYDLLRRREVDYRRRRSSRTTGLFERIP